VTPNRRRRISILLSCALPLLAAAATPAVAQDGASDERAATGAGEVAAPARDGGFRFGSYGRINAAGDLEGGRGRQLRLVGHAPRLTEASYVELDLGYTLALDDGTTFRTLVTLAVTEALFHFDAELDGAIALRNAYVEAAGVGFEGLSLWAGSRMLRGDDIYLLDFWPLDDLNTVGGGGAVTFGTTTLSAHLGLNQVADAFQIQTETVPAPDFGTEEALLNDRVRVLASLRAEHQLLELGDALDAKLVGYFEYHGIGEGRFDTEDDVRIELPDDRGYTLGLQLGAWGFGEHGFANLFFRYSRGLAAYDELAVPYGLADDRRSEGARLMRFGASANIEGGPLGVTLGAYFDRFEDADDDRFDPDDYSEAVLSVRPVIFVTDLYHQAFEVSVQRRAPDGLSARTDTYLAPTAWQLGVIPSLSFGRGAFARPQLRAIYAVTLLNDGARATYPEDDPRGQRDVQHYAGIGVEWWFNSSTY
jgi:maltoporin